MTAKKKDKWARRVDKLKSEYRKLGWKFKEGMEYATSVKLLGGNGEAVFFRVTFSSKHGRKLYFHISCLHPEGRFEDRTRNAVITWAIAGTVNHFLDKSIGIPPELSSISWKEKPL